MKHTKPRWTNRENKLIKSHYRKYGGAISMAHLLPCRTLLAIKRQANHLGVFCKGKWTPTENGVIRERFETKSCWNIMRALPNRSWQSIVRRGIKLGLSRNPIHPLMISPVDAAYIAGIIDGEGCIGIYQRKPRIAYRNLSPAHELIIKVGMTDRGAVDFMKEKLCKSVKAKIKFVRPRLTTGKEIIWHNTIYCCIISGKRAAELLKAILPYLKVKRKQAILGIQFYEQCKFIRGRAVILRRDLIQKRNKFAMLISREKHNTKGNTRMYLTLREVYKNGHAKTSPERHLATVN